MAQRHLISLDALERIFGRVLSQWRQQGVVWFSATDGDLYRVERERAFRHILIEDLQGVEDEVGDLVDVIDALDTYDRFEDLYAPASSALLFEIADFFSGVAAGHVLVVNESDGR